MRFSYHIEIIYETTLYYRVRIANKDSNYMKKLKQICFISFLFLTIVSFATCHFGTQHEINKIPRETRQKMSDTDWVGIEWIGLGVIIESLAFVCLVLSLILWIKTRQIKPKT